MHTLVVTSGYLSYCCLFIISNQSAHSPLMDPWGAIFQGLPLTKNGEICYFHRRYTSIVRDRI